MKRIVFLVLLLAGCGNDETIAAFAGDAGDFNLVSVDSRPFDGRATINVSETGKISGKGPCNSYFATQSAPYPWIEIGPIGATRRACPSLEQERSYFDALRSMTLAEVGGGTLILSNDAGSRLIFQSP